MSNSKMEEAVKTVEYSDTTLLVQGNAYKDQYKLLLNLTVLCSNIKRFAAATRILDIGIFEDKLGALK